MEVDVVPLILLSSEIMITFEFDDQDYTQFDYASNVEFVCNVNVFTLATDIT